MKVHVPLDHEQVDAIIVAFLKDSISLLESDLKKYDDEDEPVVAVFSCDKEKDKKKIKKLIKAMNRCVRWYGQPGKDYEL